MTEEHKIDPRHAGARKVLRIVGPLILLVGLGFTAAGLWGFFSRSGFAPPRFTWCPFVGFPLLFLGGVMTMAGFAGAVFRYQAAEMAPVGKDAFNYLARGTREGVRSVASAIGDGLRHGEDTAGCAVTMLRCRKCNAENDAEAEFCDECGEALVKSKQCDACDEPNDADAKFCDRCGRPFVQS